MSYGMGFYTGLRALRASQLALRTIGHNVANVNTPGYTRQDLLLSATMPITLQRGFQVGTGVQVDTIRRVTDESLMARLRTQTGFFGKASMNYSRLKEIEGIYAEPGDSGLSNLLSGFFNNVSGLVPDPSDRALRGGVIQSGQSLAEGFNLLSSRLGEVQSNILKDVRIRLDDVNRHAQAIADLNIKIGEIEIQGVKANDLRDQRDRHVQALAKLMDTRSLEKNNGQVEVMTGGFMLVSGGRAASLEAVRDADGKTSVRVAGTEAVLDVKAGEIAGLLEVEGTQVPGFVSSADTLARNLILQVNRIHSTGIPRSGPFSTLRSTNAVKDGDGDGSYDDEMLSDTGLPFDIQEGALYVTVTDKATGDLTRTKIDVDPRTMTVGDLVQALNGVDHLSAILDPTGHLVVRAAAGYGFDFANRLDASPDKNGSFGGKSAAVTGTKGGPFDMSALTGGLPATFTVAVDGGSPVTVTLQASDFRVPSAATAEEVAKAINDDLAAHGATAYTVGGRVMIRTNSEGSASSLKITDTGSGVPSLLGLSTNLETGSDMGVAVTVSGSYTGSENKTLFFEADGDGQIGVTPDLKVKVYDENHTLLGILEVGQGYTPGDTLDVVDGIKVSFGPGSVSKTSGDAFSLDALSDSDTTDALVAFGINGFFQGSSASDIAVVDDLKDKPDLLCAGLSDAPGDAGNLRRLLEMRKTKIPDLDDATLEDFYADSLAQLGFETSKAESLASSQEELLGYLEDRRQAVSGVNLDEEMVNLVQYQQAFQAASRYINTMAELTQTLIQIGS